MRYEDKHGLCPPNKMPIKFYEDNMNYISQPLLTIHCLAFNHEPYIRQCLEGFVMQKTNFRFEAIVHDDVSTDGTAAIIREYADKYPDIIKPIFEKENQYKQVGFSGIDAIMNKQTHGKYVALCEGDDYWTDPYKLQKQVDFLEANPEYVLCYHNALVYNGRSFRQFIDLNKPCGSIALSDLLEKWHVPTQSIVYRRDVYDCNVPPFPNGDYALLLQMRSKGLFYYCSDIMSVYRKHSDSLSFFMGMNLAKTNQDIVTLLEYSKRWYAPEETLLFDSAIARYNAMIKDILYNQKYPFMKYFTLKFYKRAIKKKLRIVRVPE